MDYEFLSNFYFYLFGYGGQQLHFDLFGNLFLALITTVVVFVPFLVLRKVIDIIGG